jgi:hypothetical protein
VTRAGWRTGAGGDGIPNVVGQITKGIDADAEAELVWLEPGEDTLPWDVLALGEDTAREAPPEDRVLLALRGDIPLQAARSKPRATTMVAIVAPRIEPCGARGPSSWSRYRTQKPAGDLESAGGESSQRRLGPQTTTDRPFDQGFRRERATGIEPAFSAWEADVLPLNYARVGG